MGHGSYFACFLPRLRPAVGQLPCKISAPIRQSTVWRLWPIAGCAWAVPTSCCIPKAKVDNPDSLYCVLADSRFPNGSSWALWRDASVSAASGMDAPVGRAWPIGPMLAGLSWMGSPPFRFGYRLGGSKGFWSTTPRWAPPHPQATLPASWPSAHPKGKDANERAAPHRAAWSLGGSVTLNRPASNSIPAGPLPALQRRCSFCLPPRGKPAVTGNHQCASG